MMLAALQEFDTRRPEHRSPPETGDTTKGAFENLEPYGDKS